MSENEHRGIRDLSQYDSMPTQALEQILRADAETPAEQESDIELILYIMEVLARREKENQQSGKTAQQSWESFRQHYLPEQELQKQNTKKLSGRPWLRRIVACAAVVILILCIPLSSRALSLEELWDIVARWAKETFSFVSGHVEQTSEPGEEDDIGYSSLQDMLERNKIDSKIVPTFIPEDFAFEAVEKHITPEQEIYRATYLGNERKLTIRVQLYTSTKFQNSEIEAETSEVYRTTNGEYYLFSNFDQIQVIWLDGPYECMIFGDISTDEAKAMINSIEKG